MLKLIITLSAIVNFLLFIVGAFTVFERREIDSSRLKIISYFILLAMLGSLTTLLIAPSITAYSFLLGFSCTISSTALFLQCLKITRTQKLTPLYSKDNPSFLLQKGPYKYIRHPFYASYILTFLGCAIASALWWSYIIASLILYLYYKASQEEEKKFVNSNLAPFYQKYRKSAGRFLPKLFIKG